MDKEEIVLEMIKLLWRTYQELYPEEQGITVSMNRDEKKDTYRLSKWNDFYKTKDRVYEPEVWYRFREDK